MSEKNIILKAENISKQYRLGTVGTGTLSHDLNRWWHTIRGKEDPYLKVGDVNDRSSKAKSDYVWALQDINFEVEAGEVLGIIGKNGAGKTMLLRSLCGLILLDEGEIKINGRSLGKDYSFPAGEKRDGRPPWIRLPHARRPPRPRTSASIRERMPQRARNRVQCTGARWR